MRSLTDDGADDDPRVLQAAREYLADLERGHKPNRQAYLTRYPELAPELAECFDGIELAQALRPTVPPAATEYPANPLGDFQILREIGRGGMGVVYEAVQLSLGRRVALKVLSFTSSLDAKHLQRFKTEAYAAAQLHHSNIVPVHAVGCERGVHFYAMQLIEGRSLDAVIQELRGQSKPGPAPVSSPVTMDYQQLPTTAGSVTGRSSARSGRSQESFRAAALLGAQVADALQYAHDAGVIHRDVKPANLLLDAKGTVWVTDFGLAQVSADVSVTQTGDVIGTLRYMSPEQAGGQRFLVDQRTDVYSLGATLYELLTLEPVFPGQDRQALLHQILNKDPRPLRQVDRSIPVELETIVCKALAKVPTERYATAGEMAADLRRFLDERPILARRPTFLDRTRKWMRRHPAVVGAAVLLLVFGIIGLAVTTALVQTAYQQERQRAQEAEARFQLARRAADDMIRVAEEELADNPFHENLRKRLLETALAYYQEFIEQRGADPTAQAELVLTRDRVKQILADLAVLQGDRHTYLLRAGAVLDDLRVSVEQRARLTDLNSRLEKEREAAFGEFHRLTPDERRQRSLDMARANETAIAAILSPNQLGRLRQLALQGQGPMAFRDPTVTTALKLTAEQKERIRGIEAELFLGRGDRFRPGPPPPGRLEAGPPPDGKFGIARRPRPDDPFHREAMERILAVLTSQQAKQWQEMTGVPFEGSLPLVFPAPPRPFGPPGLP